MTPVQRSFFLSSVERYASLALMFVSTAALARLLTPREFGIFAVVAALTSVISASSQEFGGANYLIQRSTLTEASIRSAFTVTSALSLIFAVLLWCVAGVLGAALGWPDIAAGLRVAALGFLVSPVLNTLVALLRRDLRFGAIATTNLLNGLVTVVVSVALAYKGFSYLSPLWGQLAGATTQALALAVMKGRLRIFAPLLAECREVVAFGLYSSSIVILNVIYSAAPQLLLARVLDFDAIGLYSRAVNVTQLFDRLVIQAVGPVIMPAIAAQQRAGRQLARVYLDASALLAVLQWPFMLLIAVLTEPLIQLWLGSAWLPAAPLVRVYCLASLALFAAPLSYPVLVAAGGVRDALIASLVSLPPSLLLIFFASLHGVEAVAASALLTLPFQAAVSIYLISRRLRFTPGAFGAALGKSAIVAACSGLAAALGAETAGAVQLGPLATIALGGGLAAAAWLAALLAVGHPLLSSLGEIFASLKPGLARAGWGRLARQRHP